MRRGSCAPGCAGPREWRRNMSRAPGPLPLIVSLDTEEDNWNRSRTGITVENIAELPRQARFFERLGVRPTYFTAYQVAIDRCAAAVMREVSQDGRAELGAHLHPWNTPPLTEAFVPRNSMTWNLPADLQLAKIRTLTAALEEAFGRRPTSFRAGRYGIGPDTVSALPVRWLRAPGIAARTGLIRRLSLSPEFQSVADMLTLSARLLESGARHLHISWHTPSLKPGLSPFTATPADVERLYASIEAYFERLVPMTSFQFMTVSEAAELLLPLPVESPQHSRGSSRSLVR